MQALTLRSCLLQKQDLGVVRREGVKMAGAKLGHGLAQSLPKLI